MILEEKNSEKIKEIREDNLIETRPDTDGQVGAQVAHHQRQVYYCQCQLGFSAHSMKSVGESVSVNWVSQVAVNFYISLLSEQEFLS